MKPSLHATEGKHNTSNRGTNRCVTDTLLLLALGLAHALTDTQRTCRTFSSSAWQVAEGCG